MMLFLVLFVEVILCYWIYQLHRRLRELAVCWEQRLCSTQSSCEVLPTTICREPVKVKLKEFAEADNHFENSSSQSSINTSISESASFRTPYTISTSSIDTFQTAQSIYQEVEKTIGLVLDENYKTIPPGLSTYQSSFDIEPDTITQHDTESTDSINDELTAIIYKSLDKFESEVFPYKRPKSALTIRDSNSSSEPSTYFTPPSSVHSNNHPVENAEQEGRELVNSVIDQLEVVIPGQSSSVVFTAASENMSPPIQPVAPEFSNQEPSRSQTENDETVPFTFKFNVRDPPPIYGDLLHHCQYMEESVDIPNLYYRKPKKFRGLRKFLSCYCCISKMKD